MTNLAKVCNNSQITVDSFFFTNCSLDLASYLPICKLTGGNCFLYQSDFNNSRIENSNSMDFKIHSDKFFYDLHQLLTNESYFNVEHLIRHSNNIDFIEIIGQFGVLKNKQFSIPSCNSQSNFLVNFKPKRKFRNDEDIYFQILSTYHHPSGEIRMKVINYNIKVDSNLENVYKSIDICAMTKSLICKMLINLADSTVLKMHEIVKNILIKSLFVFRKKCSPYSDSSQMILPENIRILPLYLNSFMKSCVGIKSKIGTNLTEIQFEMFKFLKDPVSKIMKYLYPRLLRIDNIQQLEKYPFNKKGEKKMSEMQRNFIVNIGKRLNKISEVFIKPRIIPLSFEFIDMDMVLLFDNGDYIYMFVPFDIDNYFLSEIFKVKSFPELLSKKIESFNFEENVSVFHEKIKNIIQQIRIDNENPFQQVHIIYINDEEYSKQFISRFLIEDLYFKEDSFVNFLMEIHQKVLNLMYDNKYYYLNENISKN